MRERPRPEPPMVMRPILSTVILVALLLASGLLRPAVAPGQPPAARDDAASCPERPAIGQMLLVAPPRGGPEAMAAFKRSLLRLHIGGVVLYGYNVSPLKGAAEVVAYTNWLQAGLPTPLFIAVDHEGGAVQRLGTQHGLSRLPRAARVGARADEEAARAYGRLIGEQLSAVGANLNLAPVLDVRSEAANPDIARWERALGADPERVARLGSALAAGMQAAGVVAAGKHFPGIGALRTDTHAGPGSLPQSVEELRATALPPFAAAAEAGLDAVLLSHAAVPSVTGDDTPASLAAPVVQGLLRGELGYGGLAITDDLVMGGVADTYGVEAAAQQAVLAGADMVMMTNGAQGDVVERLCSVLAAEGEWAGELRRRIDASARRVRRVKQAYGIIDEPLRPVPQVVETEAHRKLLQRLQER